VAEVDDAIRAEVQALISKRGEDKGMIKAAALVRYAQEHPESALAKHIMKDGDEVAVLKWRLTIARKIISSIVSFNAEANRQVRSYISVPTDRSVLGAYRPVEAVQANPRYRAELMEEALAKAAAMRRQYAYLPEMNILWDRIDEQIARFRAEVDLGPGQAG
jgi:hypothetical protein